MVASLAGALTNWVFERGVRLPTGKVECCEDMVILCRTTLLRSPWCSAEPDRSVNFFCAPTAHEGAVGTQCAGSRRGGRGLWALCYAHADGRVLLAGVGA